MTRVRLRPKYSDHDLARIYATPHDHTRWADHLIRVDVTTSLARWFSDQMGCHSGADLSCGDGAILNALDLPIKVFGDYAPGYEITGPLEETVPRLDPVDLFICSETIEHLDDPEAVLRLINEKARFLVLSTPIGETDAGNPEHYWGWDVDDVVSMLTATGWMPYSTIGLKLPHFTYDFQIHACWRI